MNTQLTPPTLAQLFFESFNSVTSGMDESKARMQFIYMFGRSGGVTVAAIKKEGEYIGKRFIFNDDSFADVYFQAPQKLFFGKHIEGGNQVKAIEGLQKED